MFRAKDLSIAIAHTETKPSRLAFGSMSDARMRRESRQSIQTRSAPCSSYGDVDRWNSLALPKSDGKHHFSREKVFTS